MARPRLSIVIPCYNAAPFVGEAIACVLAQDVDVDEIVVVDDGSTDDSARIVAAAAPRARVVTQANQGIGAARHRGVAESGGDVVAFLDADDRWPAGSLASRLRLLQSSPALGYVGGLVQEFISPEVPADVASRMACSATPRSGRLAGTLVVRRSTLDAIGNFDASLRVGETLDWVARADAAGIGWREVPAVVLERRLHASNTMRDATTMNADYLRVLRSAVARRRAVPPGGTA